MKFKASIGHLIGAVAAVAAVEFAYREVAVKLADQVLVRADGPGFADLAAEHPWGAVDWLLRLVAASNLTGWGILLDLALVAAVGALAAVALRRNGSSCAAFGPWFAAALFVLPALSLGDQVWLLTRPQFPQLHLAMFAVFAACLAAGGKGLVAFVLLQFLLVVIGRFCFYDLPAAETLQAAWALPVQFTWDARSGGVLAVFALFAAASFVRRPGVLPRRAHALPPVLAVLLFFLCLPARDCRDQLKMEAAVREQRFGDVLAIAPEKARPERMESAWRILAMFRTDRLDRDLNRYPIVGPLRNTEEEEMIMEGPLLLFHYGLILPARRWIFETAAAKGWQPQNLRLLGDIALLTREPELARRYFRELARCPFRGDFARRRLATLDMQPPPPDAFADLADLAAIHGAWCAFTREPDAPTYFATERLVERFVYSTFLQLKNAPPPMLKMFFAAALLDGRPETLKDNAEALRRLYPDGRIAPVFLEAMR